MSDSLVPRTMMAAKELGYKKIVVAGGVAANSTLRAMLQRECDRAGLALYLPPLSLCGDNGSMIACQAYFELMAGNVGTLDQNCFATMAASEDVCRFDNAL